MGRERRGRELRAESRWLAVPGRNSHEDNIFPRRRCVGPSVAPARRVDSTRAFLGIRSPAARLVSPKDLALFHLLDTIVSRMPATHERYGEHAGSVYA